MNCLLSMQEKSPSWKNLSNTNLFQIVTLDFKTISDVFTQTQGIRNNKQQPPKSHSSDLSAGTGIWKQGCCVIHIGHRKHLNSCFLN